MSTQTYGVGFNDLLGVSYDPIYPVIPVPWESDLPKPPEDYLWDTKGWENDCLHVKVLNASLVFYPDDPSHVMNSRKWVHWQSRVWQEEREWSASASATTLDVEYFDNYFKRIPESGRGGCYVLQYRFRYVGKGPRRNQMVLHWTARRYDISAPEYPVKYDKGYVIAHGSMTMSSGTSTIQAAPILGRWAYPVIPLEEACLFDEEERRQKSESEYYMTAHGIYLRGNHTLPSELEVACARAYYDALQDTVDKLNDNNIQNLSELACILSAFVLLPLFKPGRSLVNRLADGICDFFGVGASVSKHVIYSGGAYYYVSNYERDSARAAIRGAVKSIVCAWLPYRYAYCTTQSDIKDAEKYIQKRIDEELSYYPEGTRRAYGSSTCTAKNGTQGRLRCRIVWSENHLPEGLANWNKLWRAGLEINPYVIWDMIPLSFVVDWFAPVGDYAQALSDLPHFQALVNVEEVCYSLKYVYDPEPGITLRVYSRWHNQTWPDMYDCITPRNPKLVTNLKRLGDTVALTVGGTL